MPQFPLSGAALYHTNKPEVVEQALVRLFGIRRFELPNGAEGFEARSGHIQMQRASISFYNYEIPVRIDFPEMESVCQLFVLRGSARDTVGEAAGRAYRRDIAGPRRKSGRCPIRC